MKRPLLIPLVLACAFILSAFSQEIVDKVSGINSEPATQEASQPEPIDFEVIESNTRQVYVKQSPEIAGLPATQALMNLTVQLVKEPELEELQPLPIPKADDPAVTARIEEVAQAHPDAKLLLVSASVYNKNLTQFRIRPSDPKAEEIAGWSNIDFNHFCGLSECKIKGADGVEHSYGLIMGIGKIDKPESSVTPPKLPNLATSGPTFVLTEGDMNNLETKQLIEGIHNFYKTEGARLAEDYKKQTQANEARKADLLENPPKPKDVTVRFWNRETTNPR